MSHISIRKETAGKIKRIFMKNFMCHDAMEVTLNPNVNYIVGRNGSGKSAILLALVVGLGARAHNTSRGSTIKEFVKKGKNTALIEITLANEGSMAYKQEIYGESITISRSIGGASKYRIKNASGHVISSKREELDHIISALNIQVNNPISVLNQDVSRTFLISAGPKEKYDLFMKATRLDVIGNNYKEARVKSEEARQRLERAKQSLAATKKDIDELEKKLHTIESIDDVRIQYEALEHELQWAIVITEKEKLSQLKEIMSSHEERMNNMRAQMESRDSKDSEITRKIEEYEEKIRDLESDMPTHQTAYKTAKEQYTNKKQEYSDKHIVYTQVQSKIKRIEKDADLLRKEIERLDSINQAETKRREAEEQLKKFEEELEEVDAMLRTKQTDQMHLATDTVRLKQEEQTARSNVEISRNEIRSSKHRLSQLKQQSDNNITVFGANIPRLLQRIQEEFKRGRFKKMPRGPIGSHIQMKDKAWTPAVENFLGIGMLGSFCVDNTQDAKTLTTIMSEIFSNNEMPTIMCSKFFDNVHNVSKHSTSAPGYINMLQAMEISDPVVANSLIDGRELECVLLVPTCEEAFKLMEDARRVPRNCKQCITLQGDTVYPDPNYRVYGGRPGLKARVLQVSTAEAIRQLEDETAITQEELKNAIAVHSDVHKKLKRATSELRKVDEEIGKLRSLRVKLNSSMSGLRDKMAQYETDFARVFKKELTELEEKLQLEKKREKELATEISELRKSLETKEIEVKRCRELTESIDIKRDPLKEKIRELEREKRALQMNNTQYERQLRDIQKALQMATAKVETQQRVTDGAIAKATEQSTEQSTTRSINEIQTIMEELKISIDAVDDLCGSKDHIRQELDKKLEKYGDIIDFSVAAEKSNEEHLNRLKERKSLYEDMKSHIVKKVQESFKNILSLRKYKGCMNINHMNRTLDLEINPQTGAKRLNNDARSLSGGERSYSTVAFILALWDCTGLPFYFLDEFDVFMDKINRRTIMDILMDHAKAHPQSQFTFLTPLETSSIVLDHYVTIHQLAPPERSETMTSATQP
ncbi:structural maintenance of chromosomes protein 6 isoform X2 [Cephus cinctus]|uniref:Structural maintenance of chromosomes protein 6 isoform X2 n=1 Tax=Cephus cinctus TaxID=211228 RepID=A0AAJ7BNU8_CEPCN|nr:structural maintenance of chromosomes protein 6 isoform X2 [Cephus cinctus]